MHSTLHTFTQTHTRKNARRASIVKNSRGYTTLIRINSRAIIIVLCTPSAREQSPSSSVYNCILWHCIIPISYLCAFALHRGCAFSKVVPPPAPLQRTEPQPVWPNIVMIPIWACREAPQPSGCSANCIHTQREHVVSYLQNSPATRAIRFLRIC